MRINFIIQGKVQAKQRPRFNGKFAYTPEKTVAYENWVKTCYLEKYRGQKPLEKPLKVKIIAYLDDKQVVKLEVEKYYSQVPSVAVVIEEMEIINNGTINNI